MATKRKRPSTNALGVPVGGLVVLQQHGEKLRAAIQKQGWLKETGKRVTAYRHREGGGPYLAIHVNAEGFAAFAQQTEVCPDEARHEVLDVEEAVLPPQLQQVLEEVKPGWVPGLRVLSDACRSAGTKLPVSEGKTAPTRASLAQLKT